jgi:hypothetical protein
MTVTFNTRGTYFTSDTTRTSYSSPNRNGTGTGTYIFNSSTERFTFSLSLRGIDGRGTYIISDINGIIVNNGILRIDGSYLKHNYYYRYYNNRIQNNYIGWESISGEYYDSFNRLE